MSLVRMSQLRIGDLISWGPDGCISKDGKPVIAGLFEMIIRIEELHDSERIRLEVLCVDDGNVITYDAHGKTSTSLISRLNER